MRHNHPNNNRSQIKEDCAETPSTPVIEILAGMSQKLVQKNVKPNPQPAIAEQVYNRSLDYGSAQAGSSDLSPHESHGARSKPYLVSTRTDYLRYPR